MTKTTNKKRPILDQETNDKVLVKFKQGDIRKPTIVGSTWNKSDKPPETNLSKKTSKSITKRFKIKPKIKSIKKSTSKTKKVSKTKIKK